jgi:hypothetical protein
MLLVVFASLLLIGLTALIHYEVLSLLNHRLPALALPSRSKLLVVIFTTFIAHAIEILVYAVALYLLSGIPGVGHLKGEPDFSLINVIFFSTETYTSLGFGDVTPVGALRLLVGVEALNGLLLIGWSASYAYIAMERYWVPKDTKRRS